MCTVCGMAELTRRSGAGCTLPMRCVGPCFALRQRERTLTGSRPHFSVGLKSWIIPGGTWQTSRALRSFPEGHVHRMHVVPSWRADARTCSYTQVTLLATVLS